ncbi:50S ribosomal protein L27 [Patescibacteria group bacterium]|nr:50S ribosomal protein L27 [Patescibacteria group bacterium]
MAHVKAGGTSSLGRDSQSKRLGIKIYGGQFVKAGGIIVRQRGTKYRPGENVKKGNDDTLYSGINGYVKFAKRKLKKFTGNLKQVTIVNVLAKK